MNSLLSSEHEWIDCLNQNHSAVSFKLIGLNSMNLQYSYQKKQYF